MTTPGRRGFRALIIGVVAGLIVLTGLLQFIGVYSVTSPSMAPGIVVGDRVLVDKLSYREGVPARGDVVAFRESRSGTIWIKRVVGLPGDRIEMRGGTILINGTPLHREAIGEISFDESGMARVQTFGLSERTLLDEGLDGRHWQVAQLREARAKDGVWTVPAGALFVLGDNRDASEDSRDSHVGFVPARAVVGRVCRTVYSTGSGGMRARWWRMVL